MSPRQPSPEPDATATENPAKNRPGADRGVDHDVERDAVIDDRGIIYDGTPEADDSDDEHERITQRYDDRRGEDETRPGRG